MVNARDARIRLDELLKEAQRQRDARTRAEANLESAQKALEETEAEIRALGLDPETLSQHITAKEKEIDELIAKAERLLTGGA